MRSRLPLLLSVTALLLLAVLVARGRSAVPFVQPQFRLPFATPSQTQQPRPAGGTALEGLGAAVDAVVLVVVIVTVLFGAAGALLTIGLIARRRRNAAPIDPAVSDDLLPEASARAGADALLRGTRAAAAELRAPTGGPPSDRVVAAWLALEDSATASGTRRLPHQTPSEFVENVLAAHHVDTSAMTSLRELYARARFSPSGTVTDADAEAAGHALDRIVVDLMAPR